MRKDIIKQIKFHFIWMLKSSKYNSVIIILEKRAFPLEHRCNYKRGGPVCISLSEEVTEAAAVYETCIRRWMLLGWWGKMNRAGVKSRTRKKRKEEREGWMDGWGGRKDVGNLCRHTWRTRTLVGEWSRGAKARRIHWRRKYDRGWRGSG